jgi:hypothetical protein
MCTESPDGSTPNGARVIELSAVVLLLGAQQSWLTKRRPARVPREQCVEDLLKAHPG